ncbi:MAG: hypothetical protein BIFFINMI_02368 [Phycisphaerae bacterium]|nr:hypothetical protein [Phycisphaerae bacterium]
MAHSRTGQIGTAALLAAVMLAAAGCSRDRQQAAAKPAGPASPAPHRDAPAPGPITPSATTPSPSPVSPPPVTPATAPATAPAPLPATPTIPPTNGGGDDSAGLPAVPSLVETAGPSVTTQEATPEPPAAPDELARLPAAQAGQWALYRSSMTGRFDRRREVVTIGPGPNDVTVREQLMDGKQPVGSPGDLVLPRQGRLWPRPVQTAARTVRYDREQVEAGGRRFDCIVLTVESHGRQVLVERTWISPAAPIDGMVRHELTIDRREAFKEELVEFGMRPVPSGSL